MAVKAADDPEVGRRLKAMQERAWNICYDRASPRPSGTCWCNVLKEPGQADLPCPPTFVEPK